MLDSRHVQLAKRSRWTEANRLVVAAVEQRDIAVVSDEQGAGAVADVEDGELHLLVPRLLFLGVASEDLQRVFPVELEVAVEHADTSKCGRQACPCRIVSGAT
jgi:hypothetical protein